MYFTLLLYKALNFLDQIFLRLFSNNVLGETRVHFKILVQSLEIMMLTVFKGISGFVSQLRTLWTV